MLHKKNHLPLSRATFRSGGNPYAPESAFWELRPCVRNHVVLAQHRPPAVCIGNQFGSVPTVGNLSAQEASLSAYATSQAVGRAVRKRYTVDRVLSRISTVVQGLLDLGGT